MGTDSTINLQSDEAYKILLAEYALIESNFPEEILRETYLIERAHQYEIDRELSSSEINRLITLAIEREIEGDK